MSVSELEKDFTERMYDTCRQAYEVSYDPTRFLAMLKQWGGRLTAKKLTAARSEPQAGLKRLATLNRLDIAMETVMLEEKFRPLFTEQELAIAKWRLLQVKL